MEVTDIMIGDYVEDIDFGIGEVISINFEGGEYTITLNLIGDVTKPYSHVSPEGIKPIPLTKKILEKNGFKRFGTAYLLETDRSFWLDNTSSPTDYKDNYWIRLNKKGVNIKYLHQLQHAIKLCEIDKIIKL